MRIISLVIGFIIANSSFAMGLDPIHCQNRNGQAVEITSPESDLMLISLFDESNNVEYSKTIDARAEYTQRDDASMLKIRKREGWLFGESTTLKINWENGRGRFIHRWRRMADDRFAWESNWYSIRLQNCTQ